MVLWSDHFIISEIPENELTRERLQSICSCFLFISSNHKSKNLCPPEREELSWADEFLNCVGPGSIPEISELKLESQFIPTHPCAM